MKLMQSISMIVVAAVFIVCLFPIVETAYDENNTTNIDSESEWEEFYLAYYSEEGIGDVAYEYARYIEYSEQVVETIVFNDDSVMSTGYNTYEYTWIASCSSPLAVISDVFCASYNFETECFECWYLNVDELDLSEVSSTAFYWEYVINGCFDLSDYVLSVDDYSVTLNYSEDNGGTYVAYSLGNMEYMVYPHQSGNLVMPVYDVNGTISSDFDFSTYIGLGVDWYGSDGYSMIYLFNIYYDSENYQMCSVVAQIDIETLDSNATAYIHFGGMWDFPYEYELESAALDVLSLSVNVSETYETAYEYVATFSLTDDESEDSELVSLLSNMLGLYAIIPMDYTGVQEDDAVFGGVVSAVMLMIVILIVSVAALTLVWKAKRS